ncbi:DNA double-strand break repair Rad50 ATPase, putative [Entamoeba invadens IP1]|uniref:DNA double-strand break repair Rad50 ATPase, putative n=1 Tax=Entamoeba invadens IP1 TaxID=370355 RepID=A0A0A1TZ23_ENTIV|nr:DNA double-strand break repair Rad50 ATPase, putative [Entamoeba invadens IP1]ELP86773.1 DNA double-strand break repair Rad50 ATPase, putative [Entamoeba invadens IP1]|eukprot:XP_004253544.1 DNA double-strand break repair Rad50 ATPase, putative [Entamoeba invadens IP1]
MQQKEDEIKKAGKYEEVLKAYEQAKIDHKKVVLDKAMIIVNNTESRYKQLVEAKTKADWRNYDSHANYITKNFTNFIVKDTQTNVMTMKEEIIKAKPEYKNYLENFLTIDHKKVVEELKKEEEYISEEKKFKENIRMINSASYDRAKKLLENAKTFLEKFEDVLNTKNNTEHQQTYNEATRIVRFAMIDSVYNSQFSSIKSKLSMVEYKMKEHKETQKDINELKTLLEEQVFKNEEESSFLKLKSEMIIRKPDTQKLFDSFDNIRLSLGEKIEDNKISKIEQKAPEKVFPKIEKTVEQKVEPKIEKSVVMHDKKVEEKKVEKVENKPPKVVLVDDTKLKEFESKLTKSLTEITKTDIYSLLVNEGNTLKRLLDQNTTLINNSNNKYSKLIEDAFTKIKNSVIQYYIENTKILKMKLEKTNNSDTMDIVKNKKVLIDYLNKPLITNCNETFNTLKSELTERSEDLREIFNAIDYVINGKKTQEKKQQTTEDKEIQKKLFEKTSAMQMAISSITENNRFDRQTKKMKIEKIGDLILVQLMEIKFLEIQSNDKQEKENLKHQFEVHFDRISNSLGEKALIFAKKRTSEAEENSVFTQMHANDFSTKLDQILESLVMMEKFFQYCEKTETYFPALQLISIAKKFVDFSHEISKEKEFGKVEKEKEASRKIENFLKTSTLAKMMKNEKDELLDIEERCEKEFLSKLVMFLKERFDVLKKSKSFECESFVHQYSQIALIVKGALMFTKTFSQQFADGNKDIKEIKSLYTEIDNLIEKNNLTFEEILAVEGAMSCLESTKKQEDERTVKTVYNKYVHKTQLEKFENILKTKNRNADFFRNKMELLNTEENKEKVDFYEQSFNEHRKKYFTENTQKENKEIVEWMKRLFDYTNYESLNFTISQQEKKSFIEKISKETIKTSEIKNRLNKVVTEKNTIMDFLLIGETFNEKDVKNSKILSNVDFQLFDKFVKEMTLKCYTLEMAVFLFGIKFVDFPDSIKESLKLYNVLILLKTCAKIEMINILNQQEKVHEVYINYNTNLLLKLKGIVVALKDQIPKDIHIEVLNNYITKATKEINVDPTKMLLFKSELKFIDNYIKTSVKLNTKEFHNVIQNNSTAAVLRANYSFSDKVRIFVKKVDTENFDIFGFLPNVFSQVQSTFPLANKTPQSDCGSTKSIFGDVSANSVKNFISEFDLFEEFDFKTDFNNFNFKQLLLNANNSQINALMCKNEHSLYQFNLLDFYSRTLKIELPLSIENDDNLIIKEYIINSFNNNKFEGNMWYQIKNKETTETIEHLLNFAGYQLDAPKSLPTDFVFGCAVPLCTSTGYFSLENVKEKTCGVLFNVNYERKYKEFIEDSKYELTKTTNFVKTAIFEMLRQVVEENYIKNCKPKFDKMYKEYYDKVYAKEVAKYTNKVILTGLGATFEIEKTNVGFSIRVKTSDNSRANKYQYNYNLTKELDGMELVYDTGMCYKRTDGLFEWTYRDYFAMKHNTQKRFEFDQKNEINLPADLLVMITYIEKMDMFYDNIDQKIKEDKKERKRIDEINKMRGMGIFISY